MFECVDWIQLAPGQGEVASCNKPSGSMQGNIFLYYLSECDSILSPLSHDLISEEREVCVHICV
jgi:hypothetical protein